MGLFPYEDRKDVELISAGKQRVTLLPGALNFGTMEVSGSEDLAN